MPALPSITEKKTQKHLNCANERIDKQRLTENHYKYSFKLCLLLYFSLAVTFVTIYPPDFIVDKS